MDRRLLLAYAHFKVKVESDLEVKNRCFKENGICHSETGRAPKVLAPGQGEGWVCVVEATPVGGGMAGEGVGGVVLARGAVVGAVGIRSRFGMRRKASQKRAFQGGWKS